MMKRIWTTLLLTLLTLPTFAEITIADGQKVRSIIVYGKDQTASEKFALKELMECLGKITGAKFEATSEAEAGTVTSAIYLGWTDFARKSGIDFNSLQEEEWLIKTVGNNLILTGGRPRGSLYAVYDFLEHQAGCLWMDEHNDFIPSIPEFKIADLNIKKKPVFRQRDVYDSLSGNPTSILFKTRNKGFCYAGSDMGDHMRFGGVGKGANHMLAHYVEDCPEDQKEKVAALIDGKRVFPEKGCQKQFCWASPEGRELALKKLIEYIVQDRKDALAGGYPPPAVYDMSPADNAKYCGCEKCKTLAAQEGSYSGPLLDFINYIAVKIKKDYPDIQIRTLAYIGTQEPPKNIKPADNVIIQIAILGVECCFPGRTTGDTMRELTHHNNKEVYDLIKKWSKIAPKIAMYGYWGLVYNYNPFFENVYSLQPDFLMYKNMNVIDVFGGGHTCSFVSLNRWILYKLLENPEQDSEILIDSFSTHFYGKAAPTIKEYLHYLTKRQNELQLPPGEVFLIHRDYADINFFKTSLDLLVKAEKLADGNEKIIANVQREQIPVIGGLLEKWNYFTEKERESIPFDKEELLKKYSKYSNAAIDYYFPVSPSFFPWLDTYPAFRERMFDGISRNAKLFQQGVAIPSELEGKDLIDTPLFYVDWSNKEIKLVDDADSARGKAIMYSGKGLDKEKNIAFEVYNNMKKQWLAKKHVPTSEAPQDERYHLYKAGPVSLGKERCTLAITESWAITIPVNQILPPARMEENNEYDVYVSAKLQGPKFASGSTKENAFFVDGAYLVKVK